MFPTPSTRREVQPVAAATPSTCPSSKMPATTATTATTRHAACLPLSHLFFHLRFSSLDGLLDLVVSVVSKCPRLSLELLASVYTYICMCVVYKFAVNSNHCILISGILFTIHICKNKRSYGRRTRINVSDRAPSWTQGQPHRLQCAVVQELVKGGTTVKGCVYV